MSPLANTQSVSDTGINSSKWVGLGIGVGILIGFTVAATIFGMLGRLDGRLRQELDDTSRDVQDKNDRISELEREKNTSNRRHVDIAGTITRHEQTIWNLRTIETERNQVKQERNNLRTTVQSHERTIQNGKELLEALQQKYVQLQATVAQLQQYEAETFQLWPRVLELQQTVVAHEEQVNGLSAQLSEAKEREKTLLSRVEFVKQKMAEKNASEADMKIEAQKAVEAMEKANAAAMEKVETAMATAKHEVEEEHKRANHEIERAKREATEEIELVLRVKNREIDMARKGKDLSGENDGPSTELVSLHTASDANPPTMR